MQMMSPLLHLSPSKQSHDASPASALPGVPNHRAAAARHWLHSACLPEPFVKAASVDNERVLLVAATLKREERKADEKVTAFSSEGSFFP